MRSTLAEVLGIDVSLLQSGMGGVAGAELACAVSNAGAAGCIGGYKLAGPALSAILDRLTAGTDRPVGVNLIPEVVGPDDLDRQLSQVLDETPRRVYVSLFGMPSDAVLDRVSAAGRKLVVQVGTVRDGVHAAGRGAVVVAQGIEAGGHLLGHACRDELVAELRDRLPDACVVAAGGIGSAGEAGRALDAGADGVLLGTAFVVARESRAHSRFKAAVTAAAGTDTVISDVYEIGWPGRRHRVLATAVTSDPEQAKKFIGRTVVEGKPYLVPRFSAAVPTEATSGRIEEMAMYCGLSCGAVADEVRAAEVVAEFAPVLRGAEVVENKKRTEIMSVAETQEHHNLSYRDTPRIVTREGVELYYEVTGEGTAITCLNNFFITSPFWREYTEELVRNYRVVTYDMCNHGGSSSLPQEPTWEEHGADVIGLLDALEIESTYLIGTSASTQLARDVALEYPDRVKGLILAGPVLGLRGMRRHRQLNRSWLLTLKNHGMAALYNQMYPEVISGDMNEESGTPGFLGLRESFLAMSTPEQLANGLNLVQQGETSPEVLSRISQPTVIVLGDDDILLSPTRGRDLAALFPNGRLELMENAGHVPFLDDMEGFQVIVRKFIEEAEAHA